MPQLNIQAVVDEFLARYQDNGQAAKDIRKQIFQASVTESFFQMRPWSDDYYRSVYATVEEVVQAFSIPFTPKSTLTFKPWETKLGEFKIDDLMTPDKFRHSWLGFLVNIAEKDRSKWPILIWYIRQMLLPKSEEDMEEKIAFRGWMKTGFDAVPTVDGATFERELTDENAPTPANAAMDGILIQIIKMVAQSRANVITLGALETDPVLFCTQIETFMQDIPRTHRSRMDYLFLSEDLKNRYVDGRREKYNKNYAQEADLMSIDKVMTKVQPLPCQDLSDKIWCTPANNRIRPVHVENTGRFDTQKLDRSVKLLTDYKKLLTFDVPEFVYTNDLENTITAQNITDHYTEA